MEENHRYKTNLIHAEVEMELMEMLGKPVNVKILYNYFEWRHGRV